MQPVPADPSAPDPISAGLAAGPAAFARVLDLVEVVTVGLPFCAFKIITGLDLVSSGLASGWILIVLGALDAALNAVNGITVAWNGVRRAPICALDALFAPRGPGQGPHRELGLALDTMLAFTLVAGMIALNRLGALPAASRGAWNVAVVLNVLGAGGIRLAKAVEVLPRRA
jgi:hypothetical protein